MTARRAAVGQAAEPAYFDTAIDFAAWLDANAASAPELLVGFRKLGSGLPSLTWPESVDEALRHGWIDGVRRRIDVANYCIRFTPRKPGSIWSAVNIAKAEALLSRGRMAAAGAAAFAARTPARSKVYAYEREAPAELSAAELRAFRGAKAAWTYFEASPPGYRRTLLHWVASAKRVETRAARLAKLVEACAAGVRLR